LANHHHLLQSTKTEQGRFDLQSGPPDGLGSLAPLARRGVGEPDAKLCRRLSEPGDAPGAVLTLHLIERMCGPGFPRAWLDTD